MGLTAPGNPRGIFTTEFWITMLTYAINFLNLIGAWNFISNWHSGLIMVIATGCYKVARGLAKTGLLTAPNDPRVR